MIEVSHLTKIFGVKKVVDDLSFRVNRGEILGFLGPNGAGKSTTMKMLTGFLAPDAGSIVINDIDVQKNTIDVKKQLGYLPEGAPCYGDMTVQQFLHFIAEIRGFKNAEKKSRVHYVIERLQLQSVLHQAIDTLSKGFKRRVGLAQAIIHDPAVLILDEPTDGLDPNQKYQVRELIENLSKDKIVIISTHILEEVAAVCSRAIIINHGKIVADATPAQLQSRSRYHGAVFLCLTREVSGAMEKLQAVDGVESVEVEPGPPHAEQTFNQRITVFPKPEHPIFSNINAVIQQESWPVAELYVDGGRLDDVFRQVTSVSAEINVSAQTNVSTHTGEAQA